MIMDLHRLPKNIIDVIFKAIIQHVVENGSHCSLVGCSSNLETEQHVCITEVVNGTPEGRLLKV